MNGAAQERRALYDTFVGLLHDERTRRALRDAGAPYLYHDEFLEYAQGLPESDRDLIWELLRLSRYATSHHLLPRAEPEDSVWFTPTPDILRMLHRIDVMNTGRLETLLSRLHGERKRFSAHALMDEAAASVIAPEEATSRSDAREFLRNRSTPRTRTEQLVLNTFKTMQRVPEIARQPITVETLYVLQRSLAHGLASDESSAVRLRRINVPRKGTIDDWHESSKAPAAHDIGDNMERLTTYLETENDTFIHPVIKAVLAYFWLEDMRPFELTGVGLPRAMFQCHMYRAGYPAMLLLPVSHVLLHRSTEFNRAWTNKDRRKNLTDFVTFGLKAIDEALEELASSIEQHVTEHEALRRKLAFDPGLNHRQRSIIGRALRLPNANFTIAYHQRSYSIAYSTARSDLMDLVDKGYLRVKRRGHAFAFSPAANLREMIGKRRD